MKLLDYKEKNGLNYREIANETKIPLSTVYRICMAKGCIRLRDAHAIVVFTKGEVSFQDLVLELELEGGC